MGASTDGLVLDGNDVGVLELKCPVSELPVEALAYERKNFCLEMGAARPFLKPSHKYYSQIQMEMALTGCQWADFVVFTKSHTSPSLFVQRVPFQAQFWGVCVSRMNFFHEVCLVGACD